MLLTALIEHDADDHDHDADDTADADAAYDHHVDASDDADPSDHDADDPKGNFWSVSVSDFDLFRCASIS